MRSLCLLTTATLLAAFTPTAQAQFTTRSPYGQPRYSDPLGIAGRDPMQEFIDDSLRRTMPGQSGLPFRGPATLLEPTSPRVRMGYPGLSPILPGPLERSRELTVPGHDRFNRLLGGTGFTNPSFGPSYPGVPSIVNPSPLAGSRRQREDEQRRDGILTVPHVPPYVPIPHGGSSTYKMPTPSYKIPTPEFKIPEHKIPPATSSYKWWMGGAIGAVASGIAALFRGLSGRRED